MNYFKQSLLFKDFQATEVISFDSEVQKKIISILANTMLKVIRKGDKKYDKAK